MTTNNDWLKLIKVSKVSHNRQVKEHFKDIKSDTSEINGRSFLKSLLLIDNNDSAIHVTMKIVFFQFYIKKLDGLEAIATVPEIDSIKTGNNRPQLVIVYGHKNKSNKQGYSQLKIPHYSGSKTPNISSYTRGNFWARIVYKDGSKIWVYGNSLAEATKYAEKLDKFVDSKYKPGILTKGELPKNSHEVLKVYPIRADFYPLGVASKSIKWRHYF